MGQEQSGLSAEEIWDYMEDRATGAVISSLVSFTDLSIRTESLSSPSSSSPSSSSSSSSSHIPRELPQVPHEQTEEEKKLIQKRKMIASEILSTEETYFSRLDCLLRYYVQTLRRRGTIPEQHIKTIFMNVEEIAALHFNLLKELRERIGDWTSQTCIGDIFMSKEKTLQLYNAYIVGYDKAMKCVAEMQTSYPAFQKHLVEMVEKPECANLDLLALLILPVQRLPRYVLLLTELLKNTPRGHPDRNNLCAAVVGMQDVTNYLNSEKKKAENAEALLKVHARFIELPDEVGLMTSSNRYLVGTYEISLRAPNMLSTWVDARVHLFNDLVLVSRKARIPIRSYFFNQELHYIHHEKILCCEFTLISKHFKHRFGELYEERQKKKHQQQLIGWEQEQDKKRAKEKLYGKGKKGEGEEEKPPSLPSFEIPDEWKAIGSESTSNKMELKMGSKKMRMVMEPEETYDDFFFSFEETKSNALEHFDLKSYLTRSQLKTFGSGFFLMDEKDDGRDFEVARKLIEETLDKVTIYLTATRHSFVGQQRVPLPECFSDLTSGPKAYFLVGKMPSELQQLMNESVENSILLFCGAVKVFLYLCETSILSGQKSFKHLFQEEKILSCLKNIYIPIAQMRMREKEGVKHLYERIIQFFVDKKKAKKQHMIGQCQAIDIERYTLEFAFSTFVRKFVEIEDEMREDQKTSMLFF